MFGIVAQIAKFTGYEWDSEFKDCSLEIEKCFSMGNVIALMLNKEFC